MECLSLSLSLELMRAQEPAGDAPLCQPDKP